MVARGPGRVSGFGVRGSGFGVRSSEFGVRGSGFGSVLVFAVGLVDGFDHVGDAFEFFAGDEDAVDHLPGLGVGVSDGEERGVGVGEDVGLDVGGASVVAFGFAGVSGGGVVSGDHEGEFTDLAAELGDDALGEGLSDAGECGEGIDALVLDVARDVADGESDGAEGLADADAVDGAEDLEELAFEGREEADEARGHAGADGGVAVDVEHGVEGDEVADAGLEGAAGEFGDGDLEMPGGDFEEDGLLGDLPNVALDAGDQRGDSGGRGFGWGRASVRSSARGGLYHFVQWIFEGILNERGESVKWGRGVGWDGGVGASRIGGRSVSVSVSVSVRG